MPDPKVVKVYTSLDCPKYMPDTEAVDVPNAPDLGPGHREIKFIILLPCQSEVCYL